jgi:iron complex outermembrane receptor protein
LVYSRGKDFDNVNLPFISPLSYSTSIAYSKKNFHQKLYFKEMQNKPILEAIYGEDKTPDYAIINANFGYKFNINKSKLITKFGIENILILIIQLIQIGIIFQDKEETFL